MRIEEDIKPVTYLKSHAADVLEQLSRTRRPIVVTQNGEPRAVIQDARSYEEMRRALGLMKILSQGERDIASGKVKDQEEVFTKLERKLKKQRRRGSEEV
jgi:prevent-host-death family protein